MNDQERFQNWLSDVDDFVEIKAGLGMDDLPDCCYRDWYEEGMTANVAAVRALHNGGGEF